MQQSDFIRTMEQWTSSLANDTSPLIAAMTAAETPREARRLLVGALSFFIRKVDIVPDYVEGIGLVDDAFVLRVASALAEQSGLGELDVEVAAAIEALAESTAPIKEFLWDLYPQFEDFVRALPDQTVRGRTADNVLDDPAAREDFLREVNDELRLLEVKPFLDSDRVLTDLKAFIRDAVKK